MFVLCFNLADNNAPSRWGYKTLSDIVSTIEQRIDEVYRNLYRSAFCARDLVAPQLVCPTECTYSGFEGDDSNDKSCACR